MENNEYEKIGKILTTKDICTSVAVALAIQIEHLQKGLGNGNQTMIDCYNKLKQAADLIAEIARVK